MKPLFWIPSVLVAATCWLPAQEEGEGARKEPDPQVSEDISSFRELVADKKMSKDLEARAYLAKWVQDFDTMHAKDQAKVVTTLAEVFTKAKPREPEKIELYDATAVALSRMGKGGAKALQAAFTNSRFRKPEWVPLRSRLIASLGQTKELAYQDFILDTALRDPEDQIMAKAGEALANYEKADIKVRREIVKKLLKRFVEIHNQSRTESLDDPVAQTRQRTYAAISDPWNTTLAKLSGQSFRSPQDWEKWWNNHKDEDWGS